MCYGIISPKSVPIGTQIHNVSQSYSLKKTNEPNYLSGFNGNREISRQVKVLNIVTTKRSIQFRLTLVSTVEVAEASDSFFSSCSPKRGWKTNQLLPIAGTSNPNKKPTANQAPGFRESPAGRARGRREPAGAPWRASRRRARTRRRTPRPPGPPAPT